MSSASFAYQSPIQSESGFGRLSFGAPGFTGVRSGAPADSLFKLFAQALFSAPVSSASTEPASGEPSLVTPTPSETIPRLKAMIVDGSEYHLNAVRTLLRSLGIDTLAAETGDDALRIIERTRVDIVFIEWELPDTNGLVLAHAIRNMRIPQPVIIGSAVKLSEEIKHLALSTGMDHFCDKPIGFDRLLTCLRGSGFSIAEPELAPEQDSSTPASQPPFVYYSGTEDSAFSPAAAAARAG